jgi:hypothetical protein
MWRKPLIPSVGTQIWGANLSGFYTNLKRDPLSGALAKFIKNGKRVFA